MDDVPLIKDYNKNEYDLQAHHDSQKMLWLRSKEFASMNSLTLFMCVLILVTVDM